LLPSLSYIHIVIAILAIIGAAVSCLFLTLVVIFSDAPPRRVGLQILFCITSAIAFAVLFFEVITQ
jgi:hypothetical protein